MAAQKKKPSIRDSILNAAKPLFEIALDVGGHYGVKLYQALLANRNDKQYYDHLTKKATSYEQWAAAGYMLDRIEGSDSWKHNPESPFYDYELIKERLNILRTIRKNGDIPAMIFNLRTSLSRNLGDMGNPMLYEHTRVGTKELIEDYIDEVTKQLNFICDVEIPNFSTEDKIGFLSDTQKAFGRTALLLSGGGTFGLAHSGVIKTLMECELLPRIITGSSAGSIVAAIMCSRTEKELHFLFEPQLLNLNFFEREKEQGNIFIKISRFMKHGVVYDVEVFHECMEDNLGDITFLEAFNRTRRILNITVSSSTNFEMPKLLNYLTAPNVIIRSAVAASCAVPFIYKSAPLLAKDAQKNIVPWNPSGHRWIDGSVEGDLPMQRVSELFGVNHYCVTQTNPHIVPFMPEPGSRSSKITRAIRWVASSIGEEFQHRLAQIIDLGIHNSLLLKGHAILSQTYSGDITIVPNFHWKEFFSVLSTPTPQMLKEFSEKGEKATWSKIAILRNHMMIEQSLNKNLLRLRGRLIADSDYQRQRRTFLLGEHHFSGSTPNLSSFLFKGSSSVEDLKTVYVPKLISTQAASGLELMVIDNTSPSSNSTLVRGHRSAGDVRNALGFLKSVPAVNKIPIHDSEPKSSDPLFFLDVTFEDSDSDFE